MRFGRKLEKFVTINGVRYRVWMPTYTDRLMFSGPGLLVHQWLPEGVTLDSHDLRDWIVREVEEYRKRSRAASEMIQQRVREGKV